jgi:hypothetical protein
MDVKLGSLVSCGANWTLFFKVSLAQKDATAHKTST